MMYLRAVYTLLVCAYFVLIVNGHGRLVDPASRSTMWRLGFDNPPNYNDNQLFCGGKSVQWDKHGGMCGVCGDEYGLAKPDNEAGGKYANGIIVKKYDVGQWMDITVHLTANHKGWFEYRLCQNDDVNKRVEKQCFDKNLLADKNGETRFTILKGMERVTHQVQLPVGLTCKDCVLQWKYNTGNSWAKDPVTQESCVGCGPQEQFYACADIAIGHPEIVTGESNQEVEVPRGDIDERKQMNKTVNYDPDGACMPCNCGQTGTNDANISLPTQFTIGMLYAIAVMLAAFAGNF